MERVIVRENMDRNDADLDSMLEKAIVAKGQAASDVRADILTMINNPVYSDIVFVCKDGVRVYASRLFLAARSEVLHRMLLNGMAESQLSEITLQEVSSPELVSVIEFLYTGTLEEYAPKDWKSACQIIAAARFFLLGNLELIAVNYLLMAAGDLGVDIEAAAKFLSVAVEFVDMLGETVELIARDLVCIFESRYLKPEHLQALSGNALVYFLQVTKCDSDTAEANFLSHAEFLRFRNIVLWCACKTFASDTCLALQAIPPEIECLVDLLEKSKVQKTPLKTLMNSQQFKTYSQIRGALAVSVEPYLPLVNFRRVPPWFLINVVEPLEIVPSLEIMDAYRFHAMRPPPLSEESILGWSTDSKCHEIYRMHRDGSVIQQTAPGIGFARHGLAIDRETCGGIYEWEIIIEKVSDGFIEIGLHQEFGSGFNPLDGGSLSGQPGGWAMRMDPQGITINRRGIHRVFRGDPSFARYGKDCSRLVYGKNFAHKDSKIRVCLNMYERACSFFVDNEDMGTAWESMPAGTFYPAISLGTGPSGRIRIRFLRVCEDVFFPMHC